MKAIEIRHLEKCYPDFRLKDITFSVEAGTIAGFVGGNGAGKTTTIKSMLHLIHPEKGEILYDGRSLYDNEAERKKTLGYSNGAVSWYPRKKIGDILNVEKSMYDTWDEEASRRYLDLFRLNTNKTVRELSEGMKVKFNLLVALSHRARILILDEPTSGLDPFSRDELLLIFTRLKEEGVTVFFSTHIISDLENCADQILYLSRGELRVDLPLKEFQNQYARDGETLEKTLLRLERSENT